MPAIVVLLLAIAPPAAAPPADPLAALHGIVVDNIRHCAKPVPGEAVVCARDRGFAEGYRLPKLDPRYDKAVSDPAVVAAVPPKPCPGDDPAKAGCSIHDYEQWRAWQRLRRTTEEPPR